jgi:uncharacterized protein DUF6489
MSFVPGGARSGLTVVDHIGGLRGREAVALHLLACASKPDVSILGRGLSNARSGAEMKVNIEIDCTPVEARQFFGFPDLAPMQTAVMDKLQQQMMSNIEKISPESLIQSWFSFDPKLAERFQEMFVTMAGLGGALTGDKRK